MTQTQQIFEQIARGESWNRLWTLIQDGVKHVPTERSRHRWRQMAWDLGSRSTISEFIGQVMAAPVCGDLKSENVICIWAI